ncbi:Arc family DNA-binding protein [Xanthomonas arboricola]|uniref:Arc family DNA-binding protein n=1 Tax=Xanthomonas arboricola TaxID=56448 RepID=UPI00063E8682|nr:Arc family DNA-binding protein [Xanthomonas arboricola]
MARTDPQVNFRIPAALNEQLKEAATANNRTVTAELVHRLESSFADHPVGDSHRDFLTDVIFGDFDDEEEAALKRIDRKSVEGMVKWLELVDAYAEKRKTLESMVDEAMQIYEARKADKVLAAIKKIAPGSERPESKAAATRRAKKSATPKRKP